MFAAGDMLLCSACTQNRWSQRSVSGRAGTVSSRTVQTAVSPRGDMWLVCRPSGCHSWSGLWGRGCWHLGGRAGMLQTVPRCTNSPPPNQPPSRKLDSPMCQECQGKRCWSRRFHSSLVKAAMLSLFAIYSWGVR